LLRGDGQPFHLYEVACFLKLHGANGAFWEEWRGLHAPELRRLEAVCFRLAAEWFGCRLSQVAQQEMDQLPATTRAWLDEFALEPAASLYGSSKAELWLHISLLNSRRDALSVVRRRLLPGNLPGPVDAVHIPGSDITWRRQILKRARYAAYAALRFRHHAAALWPTAASG